jgi:hypothetical protein
MNALWQANRSLADAARWGALSDRRGRSQAAELATLVTLGVVAALATSIPWHGLRVPGHAILRGTLPLVLGISLVPRRTAGSVMSLSAAATFVALRLGGLGLPNPAGWVGVLCLGPAADLALSGAKGGWLLYIRFAVAGLAANLAAFAVRMSVGPAAVLANVARPATGPGSGTGTGGGMGGGMGGGRGMGPRAVGLPVEEFWMTALASFAICGAVAGLICAALWFRARPHASQPMSPEP